MILSIFMPGKYCKYLWYVKLITVYHTGVAPVPFIGIKHISQIIITDDYW